MRFLIIHENEKRVNNGFILVGYCNTIYLRLFELKYPMLVVQQLTNFAPVIKP